MNVPPYTLMAAPRAVFQVQHPITAVVGALRLERTAVDVDNGLLIRVDKVELCIMVIIVLIVDKITAVDVHLRIAVSIYGLR